MQVTIENGKEIECGYFILGVYSFYDNYGNLYKTSEFSEWTEQKASVGVYVAITKAFGKYIVLYNDYSSNKRYMLESTDGEDFVSVEIPVLSVNRLIGCVFNGQKLIMYDGGTCLFITEDGENITEKNMDFGVSKLYFVNNKYFVSTYYNNQYTTFYGDDLDNLVNMEFRIAGIVFFNGIYYRVTDKKIYSSSDLETWEELFTFPVQITNITDMIIFKDSLVVATVYDVGAINTSRIFCFSNLADLSIYKTYYKAPSGITKFFESNGTLWCCGQYGQVGKSDNGYLWSIQTTCGILQDMYIDEKSLAVGSFETNSLMIEIMKAGEIDSSNNLISKMSADSSINWELIQGQNAILFASDSGTGKAIITYRQKYIGV